MQFSRKSSFTVSLRLAMYILLGCALGRYLSLIVIDGRDSKLDFTTQNLHLIIGFFEFAGALLNWHYLNKEREAIQKARALKKYLSRKQIDNPKTIEDFVPYDP